VGGALAADRIGGVDRSRDRNQAYYESKSGKWKPHVHPAQRMIPENV
jgi:hypothetical protein